MAIPRVKTWAAGEVLTANDLNNEFNNVTNTVLVEPFVATQAIDLNGQLLILDSDGDTLLDASTNDTIDITIGGADDFRFTADTFTALAGSDILVEDGDIALLDGNVSFSNGRVIETDAGDVSSQASITVPVTGHTFTVTGTTTIASFSTTPVGVMLYARFTGAGLNLTHHATSFIAPWGVDYRTVPNEVLCFLSLGSGNYTFWSMNGPKERTGQTITHNSSTVPEGTLEEDGSAVSRTTYSGLFQAISITYGTGNGITTFNVPDSRGRVDINVDGTASQITSLSVGGANADTLGGVGGDQIHTLTVAELPAHNHALTVTGAGASQLVLSTQTTTSTTTTSLIASAGSGNNHSNTQPWIAKKKYIRF